MNPLNSVLIEGNLVRDPESRDLTTGAQVCNFSVASDRSYKLNDALEREVSYFDVEAWSRLAQNCATNLKKGRGVRVVGRLKQDRWTDPEGRARSRVKIVAEHVEFKPVFKKAEGGETEAAAAETPAAAPMAKQEEAEAVF